MAQGERRVSLSYSQTAMGPLVSLQPIVSALGGDLALGPLAQRHELSVGGQAFLFGPASPAITEGEQIYALSQAPQVGPGGLEVPLDLLHQIYGALMGYDFTWKREGRVLHVVRRPPRDLPLMLDVVHLQGVTTLVFQFPTKPRYRIDRSRGSRITVELLGDRLEPATRRKFPPDDLVRNVRLQSDKILIDLSGRAEAQDYVLEDPFRLVFDVLPRAASARPALAAPTAKRRQSGVRTIIIDPGHGGSDGGAQGSNGTQEKDLTLILARALEQRLEQRLPVKVVLTRTGDQDVPLDSRTALANQQKGDLLISLHVNSAHNSTSRGAETYFSSLESSDEEAARATSAGDPLYDLNLTLWDLAQSPYLEESQRLAALVQAELNSTLGRKSHGVKQAPVRLLQGASMPAVLVELGFLSNPQDEVQLANATYRVRLVEALTQAVVRYKNRVEGAAQPIAEVAGPAAGG